MRFRMIMNLKPYLFAIGGLVACILSYLGGQAIAETRYERAIGKQAIVSIDRDLAVLAYLSAGAQDNAITVLHLSTDWHLGWAVKFERLAEGSELRYKLEVLDRLAKARRTRPPLSPTEEQALSRLRDWRGQEQAKEAYWTAAVKRFEALGTQGR